MAFLSIKANQSVLLHCSIFQKLKGFKMPHDYSVRHIFVNGDDFMIAVLKPGTTPEQKQDLIDLLKQINLDVHVSEGVGATVLSLIGDTSRIDMDFIKSLDMVETVKRISEPYKQSNRRFHPNDTIVEVGDVKIGGGHFALIAGPCSVESEEQIIEVAQAVKASGAGILRGGAFKPRTSPYAFQGMKDEGIRLLQKAKDATGLPIVTEIMSISTLDLFADVDMIQVGARNMQNFDLLKELGRISKPILLKRGLANTLEELLMSAEYIMNEGNQRIILCERGIRTFETAARNTLDLSAVPVLHGLTHLPVVVDPSHATGKSKLVTPMALAAAACGADAIMIEVHNNPSCALCDGSQALTPQQFEVLSNKVLKIREITG